IETAASGSRSSIGGTSTDLRIGEQRVFAKRVPLTARELRPENLKSTANIFDLPLYYQYGIGSTGFSAWREHAAHAMTTDWVLSGETPSFPLLYHSRILPRKVKSQPLNDIADIDRM